MCFCSRRIITTAAPMSPLVREMLRRGYGRAIMNAVLGGGTFEFDGVTYRPESATFLEEKRTTLR